MEIIKYAFALIITNNLLLTKLVGLDVLTDKLSFKDSIFLLAQLILSLIFSSLIVFGINTYLLKPLNLDYLSLLVFVLVIFGVNQIIKILFKKQDIIFSTQHNLIGINSIILYSLLSAIYDNLTIGQLIINAILIPLSVLFIYHIFQSINQHFKITAISPAFKNQAIWLITLALMWLAFSGLNGVF